MRASIVWGEGVPRVDALFIHRDSYVKHPTEPIRKHPSNLSQNIAQSTRYNLNQETYSLALIIKCGQHCLNRACWFQCYTFHTRKCKIPIFKTKMERKKRTPFLSSRIKNDLYGKGQSVLEHNDIFVLSIPSIQPEELVTCKFERFIIYIGFSGVHVYDVLTLSEDNPIPKPKQDRARSRILLEAPTTQGAAPNI